MTTETKPLIERYIDKEHAVGMIWCLQNHFKRIGERLDSIGVPREDPETKTVFEVSQRVSLLAQAIAFAPDWKWCIKSARERDDWSPEPLDGETIAMIVAGDIPDPTTPCEGGS